MKIRIALVGGGAGNHVLLARLDRSKFDVSLLTRKPHADWNVHAQFQDGTIVQGAPKIVSDNPQDVIPHADVILLSCPAHAHQPILQNISQYVRMNSFVGTMFGQGAFDKVAQDCGISSRLFALQLFPFVCRIISPGFVTFTSHPIDYSVFE